MLVQLLSTHKGLFYINYHIIPYCIIKVSNMTTLLGRPFDVKKNRKTDQKFRLRQILKLKPEDRSEIQIYEASQILKENSFLIRYAEIQQFSELVKHMRILFFDPLQEICRQGDEGTCFYIINSGRVGVYKAELGNIKIRELTIGNSFGELALITGESRQATITALEPTELIVLDKETFDKVIKTEQSHQIHSTYLFFKSLPLLRKVSEKLIHYFSQTAYIKSFIPDTVIIEQDAYPSGIFIISKGSVKIIRNVVFDLLNNIKKKIIIDELSVGDIFCEYSVFFKVPMHHTIVCTMPLTTYNLSRDDLANLDSSLLNEFKATCKSYPDDEALKRMYMEKYNWNNYKSNIIKTINIEKKLRW